MKNGMNVVLAPIAGAKRASSGRDPASSSSLSLSQPGLADGQVLMPDRVEFIVGGVLKCEQRVVGTGNSQEDLVELALSGPLMASLGVLDDEDHCQGGGGHPGRGFPPGTGTRPRCSPRATPRPRSPRGRRPR